MGKRITLATVKSFIKKHNGFILIKFGSSFDGMTDGLEYFNGGFIKAEMTNELIEHQLGIKGAWFVGGSRNNFKSYEDEKLSGIEVYNCCGHFTIAVEKQNIAKFCDRNLIQHQKTLVNQLSY